VVLRARRRTGPGNGWSWDGVLLPDTVQIGKDCAGTDPGAVHLHVFPQLIAGSHRGRRCPVDDVNAEESEDCCVLCAQIPAVVEQGKVIDTAS
jgi:hypothetical protein